MWLATWCPVWLCRGPQCLLHVLASVPLPCLGDALPLLAMMFTCVLQLGAQSGSAQLPSPSNSFNLPGRAHVLWPQAQSGCAYYACGDALELCSSHPPCLMSLQIWNSVPQLTYLSLAGCRKFTGTSGAQFLQLLELDLSNCGNLRPTGGEVGTAHSRLALQNLGSVWPAVAPSGMQERCAE